MSNPIQPQKKTWLQFQKENWDSWAGLIAGIILFIVAILNFDLDNDGPLNRLIGWVLLGTSIFMIISCLSAVLYDWNKYKRNG